MPNGKSITHDTMLDRVSVLRDARKPSCLCTVVMQANDLINRWLKTIVVQVDLAAKLCLSFCLELQSAKSTYQPVCILGLILMKHTAIGI